MPFAGNRFPTNWVAFDDVVAGCCRQPFALLAGTSGILTSEGSSDEVLASEV